MVEYPALHFREKFPIVCSAHTAHAHTHTTQPRVQVFCGRCAHTYVPTKRKEYQSQRKRIGMIKTGVKMEFILLTTSFFAVVCGCSLIADENGNVLATVVPIALNQMVLTSKMMMLLFCFYCCWYWCCRCYCDYDYYYCYRFVLSAQWSSFFF